MKALPAPSAAPFLLGEGTAPVLLFHGFTGSPYELITLGEGLAERGYRCHAPLLAGHGSTVQELAGTSANDILQQARAALDAIEGPLVVVGFSMGALVAGILAHEQAERVRALVLLSPAARLAGWGELGLKMARAGLWKVLPYFPKVIKGGDCANAEGRSKNPCYNKHPTKALIGLGDLARDFRQLLPELKMPCLVMHGALDRTIPLSVSEEVFLKLGASEKERVVLKHSRHLIALDDERELVEAKVAAFLQSHAAVKR